MSTLSARKRLLIAGVGLLVVALAAWFLIVSPKRAEAARLQTELQTAQAQLTAARLEEQSARAQHRRLAPLPVLVRAMPNQIAMSGIIRELNRLASASALEFDSFSPSPLVPGQGFAVLPLAVEFQGTFGRVSSFLQRLRRQVEVRNGKLRAGGRLYAIQSLQFSEGESKFPSLKVMLTLEAFVYGQAPVSEGAVTTSPTVAGGTP